MVPLFTLAVLLVAAGPRLDVCGACRKDKLCRPHAALEEAQIERLRPDLESDDAAERTAALREIAALTDAHEGVPSERVAEVLVLALEDRSLRVRELALRLLTDGQHPETTVVAVTGLLKGFEKNMWSLVPWLTGAGQEHGTTLDAMGYLETAMDVSGDVRDDRVVEALASVLLAMPTEMRGQPVAMAATRSLLELGTRDAVESVLRQLDSWSDSPEMQSLQEVLEDFALDLDVEDHPKYGRDAPEQWKRWLKKHGRKLPSKLGKWRGKPLEDGEDG